MTATPRRNMARNQRSRRRAGLLLVDDTTDVRDSYAQYFTAQGFRVATASDGADAVAVATQYRPDVIVMDLSMPRVDGIAAIRQLKADARTRHVPVILLTGYPHKAIEQGALEAGADAFLTKPCLPEDLQGHVQQLVDRTRSHPAA